MIWFLSFARRKTNRNTSTVDCKRQLRFVAIKPFICTAFRKSTESTDDGKMRLTAEALFYHNPALRRLRFAKGCPLSSGVTIKRYRVTTHKLLGVINQPLTRRQVPPAPVISSCVWWCGWCAVAGEFLPQWRLPQTFHSCPRLTKSGWKPRLKAGFGSQEKILHDKAALQPRIVVYVIRAEEWDNEKTGWQSEYLRKQMGASI